VTCCSFSEREVVDAVQAATTKALDDGDGGAEKGQHDRKLNGDHRCRCLRRGSDDADQQV